MSEPWSGGFFTHDNMVDRDFREIPDGGLEATSWTCEWWKDGRDVGVTFYAAVPEDSDHGWEGSRCWIDASGQVQQEIFDPTNLVAAHRVWCWLQGVEQ